MKLLTMARMVLWVLVAALILPSAAHARSPDATRPLAPTPTATSTPAPTPWPTPTPTLPPEQVAKFSGTVWEEAFGGYAAAGDVSVKIGDTVCGQEPSCSPPCISHFPVDPYPLMLTYGLDVVSAEVRPGCGYEGAPVTFFVGEIQAKQTAFWHAGSSQEVNLSAGPPVAYLRGSLTFLGGLDPSLGKDPVGVDAYIGATLCGKESGLSWKAFTYDSIIKSAEEQPGCGIEGAFITFKLRDKQGNTVAAARETGVWHAWGEGGNVGQKLDLTMDPSLAAITMAEVGDGSSQRSRAVPWVEASLGLLAVGGLLGITAAALRAGVRRPRL